ncbi:MAG: DinB family protein [Gemmatimonadota bacterium]|nr:DinB family protein [Gemmatimonadota bacterium]
MNNALRTQLAELVGDWRQAHVAFDDAVKGMPPKLRGAVPPGFAHSVWQVVEHIRIAQADILDFCVNPRYRHDLQWPGDYWPKAPAPKNAAAWSKAVAAVQRDRKAMQRLALDRRLELSAAIPHGSGLTYLREVLLVADHAAYHVAQIVDIRRALSVWKEMR